MYSKESKRGSKFKIKLHNKLQALEKLGDYLNLWKKGDVLIKPKPVIFVVPGFKDFESESNRITKMLNEGKDIYEVEKNYALESKNEIINANECK